MEIKCTIDLVLVKKDMLHFVQDVRAVRGMGRGISDHHVVLCEVRLEERRVLMDGSRRIRSEKLKEHEHREEYARSFEENGKEKTISSTCGSR